MDLEEIARIHHEHWREGYGSIAVDEMGVLRDLIEEHRPRSFVEVGTASGLSAGLICRALDAFGGERLVTLDHDNSFFADPSRENGFLISAIYPGGRVEVDRRPCPPDPRRRGLYPSPRPTRRAPAPVPIMDGAPALIGRQAIQARPRSSEGTSRGLRSTRLGRPRNGG